MENQQYKSIYSEIIEKITVYQIDKGHVSKAIYLGESQWERLRECYRRNPSLKSELFKLGADPKFYGISIYLVDSEDHLYVS